MSAYEAFLSGELEDLTLTDEELRASLAAPPPQPAGVERVLLRISCGLYA